MARRRRPTYSPEFKAEAIRLVRASTDSVHKIAHDLGVESSTLRRWLEGTRPVPEAPLTTDERTELQQLRRDNRRLREERDILQKKSRGLLRQPPGMIFAFILAEKAHHAVRTLCAVLGVSPSGYYAWRGRPLITPQVRANRGLRAKIRAIFAEHRGRYGSPRIHAALQLAGDRVGRNRVIRLMHADQLRARPRRRFRQTTDADPGATPAPNRLNQCFRVRHPNHVWAGDITAVATPEGWLYLAVVLDLYSRRVVGWAISRTLDARLVTTAWDRARARRGTAPRLHHSDRGSQYTSVEFQRALATHRVVCSMSRRGNCWDNAPVESFFRTLKTELSAPAPASTWAEVASAVGAYIEDYYNSRRLHSALGYRSPAQFENSRGVAA